MCIAILKPKGTTISKETLKTCSEANPDGMGFAYVDGDKLYIKKYMKFDEFYKDFEKVQDKSNMLIHFRIATHGSVELENCHPFFLNHRMALIHNGIISGYGDKKEKSDTRDFIDKVIGNISWKLMKNPSYRELVGHAIGYSKLAILDITGDYWIINEDKGYWDNGIWYSNKSYEPKKTTSYVTYYHNDGTKKDIQGQLWDMYGDEDYDTWYDRTYGYSSIGSDDKDTKKSDTSASSTDDDNIIYKCKTCGAEFVENYECDDVLCNVCHSSKVEDIGIMYRGEKYYYADMNK